MQLTLWLILPPPEVQISATSCKKLHLWMSICTSRKQSCKSKLHLATQLFQVVLYKICTLHFETTPQQKDRVETATRKWKVQLESPNLHLKKCQEVAPQGAGKLHLRNRKTTPQGAGKLHLREGQKSASQGSGLSRERDTERESGSSTERDRKVHLREVGFLLETVWLNHHQISMVLFFL